MIDTTDKATCPLCEMEKITHWHHEDDLVIVCDCMTCDYPMIVLKRHTMSPTGEDIQHMKTISYEIFGKDIMFRVNQRNLNLPSLKEGVFLSGSYKKPLTLAH